MAQQLTDITPNPNEPVKKPKEMTASAAPETQPAEKPETMPDEAPEQPTTTPPVEGNKTTAPEPAPTKQDESTPEKPAYLANNPILGQFINRLPTILSNTGHGEMWGVDLKDGNDIPTVNIMIKFLRANEGDLKLAEEQLTKSLKWRKTMNPLSLAETGRYNASKFGGLGYLTVYTDSDGKETVTTWNIYGGVKDIDATFGDADEFIKWRVALMELAIKDLKLGEATSVIEYDGEDPYQMIQVHDYQNVKFLRMNPTIRAATKKTIDVFSTAYPELLREKFFVNVPAIMGWMFAAMKMFLSKNTTRKFHPISNGVNLAREFPTLESKFPKAYGGKGPELQESARAVMLEEPSPSEAAKKEPSKETADDGKKEASAEEANKPVKDEPVKAEPVATAQAEPEATEVK
ncbi:hypothetical protein PHISCL_07978 [Aspergillus sclerotialis]|uniref:Phosphatidylinositol transfer protein SFH5 n=1 Tax=Aspergillus sclerotialis TaxID=2070753 RepID=A0A3A2ZAP0_9EURO|nr:hypothetical protein PHISCL_07978 [Aspergillus sclerotialis]